MTYREHPRDSEWDAPEECEPVDLLWLDEMEHDFNRRETTVADTIRDCPGCDGQIYGKGVSSGGDINEDFCCRDCMELTMELRAERAHDRGR
jgi:hypothetical protein